MGSWLAYYINLCYGVFCKLIDILSAYQNAEIFACMLLGDKGCKIAKIEVDSSTSIFGFRGQAVKKSKLVFLWNFEFYYSSVLSFYPFIIFCDFFFGTRFICPREVEVLCGGRSFLAHGKKSGISGRYAGSFPLQILVGEE